MILQTERLELILLTSAQLKLWIEDISALEKELNCSYRGEPMEGFLIEIVKGQLEVTQRDPANQVWHSFFFLVRKSDRAAIGSSDFKDIPNQDGEVEIGYGLGKEFEHNGYMTEAVNAMCEFAQKHPAVSHIIAETELDGYASQRTLQRCGFQKERQEETIWWKR